jgi:transposase
VVYVGIDLHRRTSHVAAFDEEGVELLSRRVTNDPGTLRALLAELGGEAKVALEAAFGWEWLADLLEGEGIELHLAHPRHTKAIAAARVKTDAVDARTLAHLLRADLLPEAYIAPRELRALRELLRHHIALTRMRTALKNRVHALLARQGVQHGRAELFGPQGRTFLAELSLPAPTRRRLESLLSLIADFDRELQALKREIRACAKDDPRVTVLTRIPGVGLFIALLVIAEVGDVTRFPSARHLASFAGLTPRVAQLGRARPARRDHPPGLAPSALGPDPGGADGRPSGGSPEEHVRAHQAPAREQGGQGRGRPRDPRALLLRSSRRPHPPSRSGGCPGELELGYGPLRRADWLIESPGAPHRHPGPTAAE